MTEKKNNPLDRIFSARGIAVFGGISRPGAFGNLIALILIRYGYPGKLYPISSKGGELNGHTIYKCMTVTEVDVEKTSRILRKAYQSRDIPVFPNVDRALRGIRHAVAHATAHSKLVDIVKNVP